MICELLVKNQQLRWALMEMKQAEIDVKHKGSSNEIQVTRYVWSAAVFASEE